MLREAFEKAKKLTKQIDEYEQRHVKDLEEAHAREERISMLQNQNREYLQLIRETTDDRDDKELTLRQLEQKIREIERKLRESATSVRRLNLLWEAKTKRRQWKVRPL